MRQIIEDYLNGMTQYQIREKYQMSMGKVNEILKPHVRKKQIDTNKMIADYSRGMTQDEIRTKYSVSRDKVSRVLKPYRVRKYSVDEVSWCRRQVYAGMLRREIRDEFCKRYGKSITEWELKAVLEYKQYSNKEDKKRWPFVPVDKDGARDPSAESKRCLRLCEARGMGIARKLVQFGWRDEKVVDRILKYDDKKATTLRDYATYKLPKIMHELMVFEDRDKHILADMSKSVVEGNRTDFSLAYRFFMRLSGQDVPVPREWMKEAQSLTDAGKEYHDEMAEMNKTWITEEECEILGVPLEWKPLVWGAAVWSMDGFAKGNLFGLRLPGDIIVRWLRTRNLRVEKEGK